MVQAFASWFDYSESSLRHIKMATNSKILTASKVVVATTVALSFISYWRGAAIVLSDLASSMFYAGGIAEQAIGKSAAWYVLGVMLFSFAVRSVYMESCGMFVRGGVYVVVRDSMGPFVARFSVSALVFDYILTGPISWSAPANIWVAWSTSSADVRIEACA